jgi:hypothetical protein
VVFVEALVGIVVVVPALYVPNIRAKLFMLSTYWNAEHTVSLGISVCHRSRAGTVCICGEMYSPKHSEKLQNTYMSIALPDFVKHVAQAIPCIGVLAYPVTGSCVRNIALPWLFEDAMVDHGKSEYASDIV